VNTSARVEALRANSMLAAAIYQHVLFQLPLCDDVIREILKFFPTANPNNSSDRMWLSFHSSRITAAALRIELSRQWTAGALVANSAFANVKAEVARWEESKSLPPGSVSVSLSATKYTRFSPGIRLLFAASLPRPTPMRIIYENDQTPDPTPILLGDLFGAIESSLVKDGLPAALPPLFYGRRCKRSRAGYFIKVAPGYSVLP